MATPRFEVLRTMLEQNPNDAFLRYGLAMEYVRSGDLENAAEQFAMLIATNPGYAAAYFHGGQTLEKLGRLEEARLTYRRGIEVTTAAGDRHTQSEIEAALSMLE